MTIRTRARTGEDAAMPHSPAAGVTCPSLYTHLTSPPHPLGLHCLTAATNIIICTKVLAFTSAPQIISTSGKPSSTRISLPIKPNTNFKTVCCKRFLNFEWILQSLIFIFLQEAGKVFILTMCAKAQHILMVEKSCQ